MIFGKPCVGLLRRENRFLANINGTSGAALKSSFIIKRHPSGTMRRWNQNMRVSRKVGLSLALGLLGLVTTTVAARCDDEGMMRVFLNHAKVLKLDTPVSKVIVGNANVADATVADARTIVLTGKAFGTTNLVLLDAVLQRRLHAIRDRGRQVVRRLNLEEPGPRPRQQGRPRRSNPQRIVVHRKLQRTPEILCGNRQDAG